MQVGREAAEAARAQMLELFPEGFEEAEVDDGLELCAYTDLKGEARMRAAFGDGSSSVIPAEWEQRWKRFHRPVRAGGIWIVPPWEQGAYDEPAIVIDPGRAFGTGAHPTTRLCLELLATLERGSLLDVGCGSGVLAIAAVRLGFGPVAAIDRDEEAVGAAARNAAANRVDLDVRRADALADPLPAADVVVANMSEELVDAVAPRLSCERLVTSGYFEPHVPQLPGFRRTARRTLEGWAADLYARE